MSTYVIVAIHLEGARRHESITKVRWKTPGSAGMFDGEEPVSTMINLIEAGHVVQSQGLGGTANAPVYVNHIGPKKFIESRADSTIYNNLLSQPEF